MTAQEALAALVSHQDLSFDDAQTLMSILMLGEVPEGLVGGLLTAIQFKGATGVELAGFAQAMRLGARTFAHSYPDVIDTCGTGGGPNTFNLSTGAALVASAAGAKVAKHGNRSVTSKCGSADALEALGVKLSDNPAILSRSLALAGIVFLFAPQHHSAMRHVLPVRKALGIRTVFNLLGPLSNPAGAKRQLIGVYDRKFLRPVGEALVLLGAERCFVVHGEDGLDEISPSAQTIYVEATPAGLKDGVWTPADFGLEPLDRSALEAGQSIAEGASILLEAISDALSPRAQALLPNVAASLVLAGIARDLPEGAQLGLAAIRSGKALAQLENLKSHSLGDS